MTFTLIAFHLLKVVITYDMLVVEVALFTPHRRPLRLI